MITTITIHVQGNLLGDQELADCIAKALRELSHQRDINIEWVGGVGAVTIKPRTWQPRTYQRRQRPVPFAGPDRRTWCGERRREAVKDQIFDRRQQPRRARQHDEALYYGGLSRSAWRGGRRSGDLHRERRIKQRRHGGYAWGHWVGPERRRRYSDRRVPHLRLERRTGSIRRGYTGKMFWIHQCSESKSAVDLSTYLHSRFCPDCGLERTTFYDRRTGAAERRTG